VKLRRSFGEASEKLTCFVGHAFRHDVQAGLFRGFNP